MLPNGINEHGIELPRSDLYFYEMLLPNQKHGQSCLTRPTMSFCDYLLPIFAFGLHLPIRVNRHHMSDLVFKPFHLTLAHYLHLFIFAQNDFGFLASAIILACFNDDIKNFETQIHNYPTCRDKHDAVKIMHYLLFISIAKLDIINYSAPYNELITQDSCFVERLNIVQGNTKLRRSSQYIPDGALLCKVNDALIRLSKPM